MKLSTGHTRTRVLISTALAALVLLAGTTSASAQKIAARPLTPQEIHDYELPEGTLASGGLMVVGVGEPIYLEVQVPKGTVVNSVVWSVEEAPLGGSMADFEDTPVPDDMPIYSVGDREVNEAHGRTMFIPDVEGKYFIKATVSTGDGILDLEAQLTGAFYVGIGTMGSNPVSYPQCALCHGEQAINYMETDHASYFTRAIDGLVLPYYNESCMPCHVLGDGWEDTNGSFFDVANQAGWTFPEVLEPGNWDAMPPEVQAMANVQCEHCHGAGSIHHGDKTTTEISLSSGDCAQCHDEIPYYNQAREWDLSGHAVATRYPTGENRGSCVPCHSGIGFIDTMDEKEDVRTDYEAIVCAACHDPHHADNPGQLRTLADVTLQNGEVITMGGTGKLCLNCHKGRRDAESYVQGNVSSHFGPHHSVQADMFTGTNAIEYGKVEGTPSAHMYAIENSCAGCHMQSLSDDDPALYEAGAHTFKMVWDGGTPEDHADDVDMVGVCTDCHGPMEDFHLVRADYNYDGVYEPIQEEVEHLLHTLGMLLPPIGSPEAAPDPDYPYTDAQKKALYNYLCVEEDGSHGMHNPRYMTAILKASIEDLSDPYNSVFDGINVPSGGTWFYSKWFDYYAPSDFPAAGDIYHSQHGYQFVYGDAGAVWLYEPATRTWRYTTPEVYPDMYVPGTGWTRFSGMHRLGRIFYKYDSAEWDYIR